MVQYLLQACIDEGAPRVALTKHTLLEGFVAREDVQTEWQLSLLDHPDAFVHTLYWDHWEDRSKDLLMHDRRVARWAFDYSERHVPRCGVSPLGTSTENLAARRANKPEE